MAWSRTDSIDAKLLPSALIAENRYRTIPSVNAKAQWTGFLSSISARAHLEQGPLCPIGDGEWREQMDKGDYRAMIHERAAYVAKQDKRGRHWLHKVNVAGSWCAICGSVAVCNTKIGGGDTETEKRI
jgi:hypothetical protein